jgi:hypothetical protein
MPDDVLWTLVEAGRGSAGEGVAFPNITSLSLSMFNISATWI